MPGLIRALLLVLALALPALAVTAGQGAAQQADSPAVQQPERPVTIDRRKLLVQPKNADGSIAQVPFLEDPVLWVREKQQDFYGRMSGSLRQVKGNSPLAAGWTLMLLSFAYGVLHAAGPGHGKAVISAWLLATESELRRGVLISFLSAIIQALTAIVLVSVLFLVVASVGSTARNLAGLLESASYAMIALLGLYLVWTALRLLRPAAPVRATPRPAQETRGAVPLHDFESFTPLKAEGLAPHRLHGPDCGCGHAHLPAARDLRGDWSLARAASLAFAVGLRPCTGAILVLLFANGLGLYGVGIASTFAMALGTFITVSAIAALAVFSKRLANRMAASSRAGAGALARLSFGLRAMGGLAILGLGTILFIASLGSTNAMM